MIYHFDMSYIKKYEEEPMSVELILNPEDISGIIKSLSDPKHSNHEEFINYISHYISFNHKTSTEMISILSVLGLSNSKIDYVGKRADFLKDKVILVDITDYFHWNYNVDVDKTKENFEFYTSDDYPEKEFMEVTLLESFKYEKRKSYKLVYPAITKYSSASDKCEEQSLVLDWNSLYIFQEGEIIKASSCNIKP